VLRLRLRVRRSPLLNDGCARACHRERSKPCKISMSYLADGTKVRVSKRTGTVIPKPAELTAKRFKNYLGTASPHAHTTTYTHTHARTHLLVRVNQMV
jgi:hypothetical protein